MPKKKIQEIVGKLDRKMPGKQAAPADQTPSTPPAYDVAQFPAGFENKAGRYELIRVDGDRAYYSFTNRQERTVDATMPVLTWKKMQERAVTYKETA